MMDVKQLLIFGLFLAPVWPYRTGRCYEARELSEAAERRLRSHYPQPPQASPAAAPDSPALCPVSLYQQRAPPRHLRGRSVSPWRYVLKTKEDHFPSTYAEAQCLCSGCILIQDGSAQHSKHPVESHSYNSVAVKQSRVFLKRELCSDGERYQLRPVTVEVTVGCTCARVNTST